MPSIQDVADQINAKLNTINTNTAQTAGNTDLIHDVATDIRNGVNLANSQISQTNSTLATGFASLSQGLFAIHELQKVSVQLLDYHRKQNDTVICELVNNNSLLCNITQQFAEQLRLSQHIDQSTSRIEGITTRVHCAASADYDRHQALQADIEQCCPQEKPRPVPCPDSCEQEDYKPGKPKGQKWEPLPTQQQPDPIG